MNSAKSARLYRAGGSATATRRQFLKRTAVSLATAGLAAAAFPAGRSAAASIFAITDGKTRRSRVALLENPRVMTDLGVRKKVLTEMLEDGLCISLDKKTPAAAWQSLLTSDDRILLKFNRADADRLGTSEIMASVLIESLMRAGFDAKQITLLEAVTLGDWAGDLSKPEFGWTEKTYDFGSGQEQLIKAAEWATAIINVPFLKTHRIAGMTGCLKNLSHGLIRRPALYHANQCCPFIPDIVAMPVLRNKIRLHVMNALRVIYDNRPDASRDSLDLATALVVSTDPVAADTIGQSILDALRQEKGLKPITPEPGLVLQHRLASEKGLGTNNIEYIDIVRPVVV